MKRSTVLNFSLALLLSAKVLSAQTPFYVQDFSGGFPAGWKTTDASNRNVLWTWCDNPERGQTGGCPPIFNDPVNQQKPFQASTAKNGFMTLDSDKAGEQPVNHVSRLTSSAINCSGRSQVFISFETHIGVYTVSAETGAILRVSNDSINWTSFTIFPGLTPPQKRWSDNPTIPIINISSVAANRPKVYLQWQWTGNYEYFWNLDDVKLYDTDPTPPHNLAIGDFFYPPSSFAQPASQIITDTFSFGANLSNLGRLSQTNVILRAAVLNDKNQELWADSLRITALASGIRDSFFALPGRFVPNLPVGRYTIRYTLRADSTDLDPGNNQRESPFVVTEFTFSKEPLPEQAYRPNTSLNEWYVANLYAMSPLSQEAYKAQLVRFTFATTASELPAKDVEASIYLLRVKENVNFDSPNGFDRNDFLSSSLEWVGTAAYSAPDTMANGIMQEVELFDISTANLGVPLKKGSRYLVAVGYEGNSKVTYHAFNNDVSYYFPSTFIYADQWYTGGFGPDVNAVIRLVLSLVSTTDEKPLPDNALRIAPTPVVDLLNLFVELEQPTDATLTIAELNGRVILMQDYPAMTTQRLSFSVAHLPAGAYLARIATPNGTLTKKFIVQR
ncbi:MAG: T9SS type A sorting domain-containing protein [Saprospiraceae bacterium]|nr:T9SS type A sorting domain-containing protein [Saprospiraceae bacterium]MDW8483073.1 T9SS type A sorting domain-containing protein [Saprospiraceae bacterium]